uniref:Uncharacterized protein n=1 Tax=Zea mays TaxID=4577 RepID=A0A804REG2_MAIZE
MAPSREHNQRPLLLCGRQQSPLLGARQQFPPPPTRTSISFSCCSPQSSLLVSALSRAGQPTPLPFFFHGRELHLAYYGRPDFLPSSLASLAQGSHGRAPLAKVLPVVASSSLRSASPTRRPCCRRATAPCPWRPCKSSPSSPCSSPCCSAGNAATALRSTPARAPFLAVRRGARRLFVKMRSKPRAAGSLFRETLWTARCRRSPWVAVFAQPLCRRRSPPEPCVLREEGQSFNARRMFGAMHKSESPSFLQTPFRFDMDREMPIVQVMWCQPQDAVGGRPEE